MEQIDTIVPTELSDEKLLIRQSLDELEFPKVLECIANYTISSLGEESVLASAPMEETVWLRQEHERLDELTRCLHADREFPLEGLSDIRALLQKCTVQHSFLSPTELLAVRDVIRVSRLVKGFLKNEDESMPAMEAFGAPLHENRLLEKHISDAIDDVGTVKSSASKELARIRRGIIDTSNRLRLRLQKILKKFSEEEVVSDDFVTQRDGRFVLPMKTEYKRFIPGIIHGSSGSGSTVYLEPADTHELNNDISLMYAEERREIARILTTLTSEVALEAAQFSRSLEILGHVDAMLAKARYAVKFGGCMPVITDANEIELINVRHPILTQAKGPAPVVPMSVSFGGDIAGHLISGPNAGGKTVALKSIGLNLAMALSGIFPLGQCRTNYRTIFTAIGDNQSIELDVSTFSSQILRIKEILACSSPVSLILVDEICSGTDPQEGSALAVGILEGLIKRGTFFVVTTHQSSLKSFALARPEISNASMEFDGDKLEPTYRLLSGVPGNSYAFALAKNLGLPPGVMERAHDYLGDKHSELEESIEAIQRYRREAEQLRYEALNAKAESEATRRKYEEMFDDFKKKYKLLMKAAKNEAAEVVADANKLVENTIREIREQSKPVAEIKKQFTQRKKIIEKAAPDPEEDRPLKETPEFAAGDYVVMENFTTPGIIVTVDRDSGEAVVEFDSVKFRTKLHKLEPTSKAPKSGGRAPMEFKMGASTKVDVRGEYPEDAQLTVENAIADALMGSVQIMTVVHGKGTGALRKTLHRMLDSHPSVAGYRLGNLNEGGAGATIIELK